MLWPRSSTWAWTWNLFMQVSGGGSAAARRLGGVDRARGALAAVVGEVREQGVHALVGGAVDDVAADALLRDEAGAGELLQMEGKRVLRNGEPFGHRARGQTRPADDDQRAEHLQPNRLSQRRERGNDLSFIHISSIVEQWRPCQASRPCGNRRRDCRIGKVLAAPPRLDRLGEPAQQRRRVVPADAR